MKKIIKHWKVFVIAALVAAIIPITIFAAAGDTNTVQYNAVNKPINGTYAKPTREGYDFIGWATTKEKADAGKTDFTGSRESIDNPDLRDIKNGETVRVYAVWKKRPIIKYAVMLYGIGQDTDVNGKTMGLTFGPATGADYTTTYKSHTPTGNDSNGNAHRCIHNDDWESIIEWNNKDPYVYEQCIDNDCTHSVDLIPNDAQKGVTFANDYANYTSTGDGPGMLSDELYNKNGNMHWNLKFSNSSNYAGSRIRAMLNGHDSHTVDADAGSDSTKFDAKTCLLASFPKVLQDAIGEKAVHYAANYKDLDSDAVVYDKLWLLSGKEIYGDSIASNTSAGGSYTTDNWNYTKEGNQYQRMIDAQVTTSNYNKMTNYYLYYVSNRTFASNTAWSLRSMYYYGGSSFVNPIGSLGCYNLGYTPGVAPGFALARSD